ncbi:MAG: hypothetical protein ACKOEO_21065, partial [Planctomycetaceae bacterium]
YAVEDESLELQGFPPVQSQAISHAPIAAKGTNNCHGGIERDVFVAINKGLIKTVCRVAIRCPFCCL